MILQEIKSIIDLKEFNQLLVFIAKLRKLLEDDPLVLIKTIRGVGLMLVDK